MQFGQRNQRLGLARRVLPGLGGSQGLGRRDRRFGGTPQGAQRQRTATLRIEAQVRLLQALGDLAQLLKAAQRLARLAGIELQVPVVAQADRMDAVVGRQMDRQDAEMSREADRQDARMERAYDLDAMSVRPMSGTPA